MSRDSVWDVNSALGNDTVSDTDGTDTFDFSGTTSQALTLNLGTTGSSQNVGVRIAARTASADAVSDPGGGPFPSETVSPSGSSPRLW